MRNWHCTLGVHGAPSSARERTLPASGPRGRTTVVIRHKFGGVIDGPDVRAFWRPADARALILPLAPRLCQLTLSAWLSRIETAVRASVTLGAAAGQFLGGETRVLTTPELPRTRGVRRMLPSRSEVGTIRRGNHGLGVAVRGALMHDPTPSGAHSVCSTGGHSKGTSLA